MRARSLFAGASVSVVLAVTLIIAACGGGATSQAASRASASPSTAVSPAPLTKLVGQLLVGEFSGTTPPAALLQRVGAGQLGSVILFSDNTVGGISATRAIVAELQAAARRGRNPPLLIMTDQEGGQVRRLPGPPTMNADQITSTAMARTEGVATGRLLRSVGVNIDLAPVSDVESSTGSFLGPRAFGTNPAEVGQRACAFAAGLASTGVGYTLKHFPGLGSATVSTDVRPVTLERSAASLAADWDAYRGCGSNPRALIMVSNAIYPNLTGPLPAVESPKTYQSALPSAVGGKPVVTISDDLQAGALKDQPSPALHAFNTGLDLAMYATTEAGSADAYTILLHDVRAGLLPRSRVQAAASAVAALKQAVAAP